MSTDPTTARRPSRLYAHSDGSPCSGDESCSRAASDVPHFFTEFPILPCQVEGCTHPSRFLGNNPDQPEGKCECHSWNLSYPQMQGTTACHRDYPEDFAPVSKGSS